VIYVFGDYQLDTQRYELRRGGALCALERQGFNVLVYLVQQRDRVVAKEELLEQLWPNQIVSENTLTQRLSAVRRVLGDSGREQLFIKTVHGRGYRFAVAVEEHFPVNVAASAQAPPEVEAPAPCCPRCQHATLPEAQFCNVCGASLVEQPCPTCGCATPPGAAFCHACGTSLNPQTPTTITASDALPEQVSQAPPSLEAERRHLTVVFCDLVESTQLAERLDPEDYREVVRVYQAVCTEVIERYDGHIAQLLGDALLIYFGWPTAHEDDAQRAVYAGLEMLNVLADANRRLKPRYHVELAMRVAVHTGLVVVGEMGGSGRQERLALGATPNVAARLQALAPPGSVVISGATHALVHGYFVMSDLGVQTLRGVARPVQVYQVCQASGAQNRFEVARRRGLTPFVGRETEVAVLSERWQQAGEGLGQVIVISGEAGIGKSRQVQGLYERVAHEPHMRLECRCSPYHQHSAFYPIVDVLERTMGFERDESAKTKLSKLEATLAPLRLAVEAPVSLLAALLSIPLDDAYEALSLTPQQQRQRTLTTLLAMVTAWSEQQPLLLVVEDLHWADPSTRELLDLLVEQAPTLSLLALLTCRPVFQHPWGQRAHLTSLTLNRLSRQQVENMVEHVTGGKPLPSEVIHHIVTRTDGVPLFVEELTRAVLESGLLQETDSRYALSAPLSSLSIPTTLHDSLMARLDRLGTAKGMAQWGATLGRQFSYALLQASSQRDEEALERDLKSLVDAELVYQRGVPPHATYQFKHALIQEAAYASLLRSTRQYYHQRIAQVLTSRFPDTVQTQPELVAYHYTEAGLHEAAIGYWQRAGERANDRSANAEARSHLTQGLDLLRTLPEGPARLQCELALQTILGRVLTAANSYGDAEVVQVYTRARQLCHQIGDAPQLFPVLLGLSIYFVVRAELHTARELGEQLLSLAQRAQDPVRLVEAHYSLGVTFFWLGDFVLAREHLERGSASYDPAQHPEHLALYGQDGGPVCLCRLAFVLWTLGYPEQALSRAHEALEIAQSLSHPFSLAYVLTWIAILYVHCQTLQEAQQWVHTAMTFSTEQGFPFWSTQWMVLQGWVLAEQGRVEEGIAQMQQGLREMQAVGTHILHAYYLGLLASTHGKVGQPEVGLALLEDALAKVNANDERWPEAELHRLRGELLLQESFPNQAQKAEACFLQAFNVAQRQYAKSPALRAAMSLSRLWQQQGKQTQARELLSEVYEWFTEGFDTADLQDAKQLLMALQA
jgi:class 3 adenylate cyclase/DNA-binding winged helix-turn-helix (wHTH) protein/predicted ATPase